MRLGLSIGPQIGPGARASGSAWSVDSGSGKAVPATADEWAALISASGLSTAAPASVWTMQEASGSVFDQVGSLDLSVTGTPSYRQAVTGWTRKAISFADSSAVGASGNRIGLAAGSGPDPASTSALWLGYVRVIGSPAGNRCVISVCSAADPTEVISRVGATGLVTARCTGNSKSGVTDIRDTVIPVAVLYNRTGSACRVYTLAEKLSPTYGAGAVDGYKGFGAAATAGSPPVGFLYGCMWSGADAEMSDAAVKAMLEALGWTIPWS